MNKLLKTQLLISRYAQAYYNIYNSLINQSIKDNIKKSLKALEKEKRFLMIFDKTLKQCQALKCDTIMQFFRQYDVNLPLEKLITLLMDTERLILLIPIMKKIIDLYNNHNNILVFRITSSHSLLPIHEEQLLKFLSHKTQKKIHAEYAVDTSLIGGIKAVSKEYCYENSIKKKLESIARLVL